MKTLLGAPDPEPPFHRKLRFAIECWAIRHPLIFRAFGAVLRTWPSLRPGLVARCSAAKQVLTRPASFSNTSHAANLIGEDFLIGQDSDAGYDADKAIFGSVLAALNVQVGGDREALSISDRLLAAGTSVKFDLIEDYLMWVALRALEPGFGIAAGMVEANSRAFGPDEELERRYMHEVRHVAANLFGGAGAPAQVQRRAEMSAASLRARIQKSTPEICMSWAHAGTAPYNAIQRNATGLAWVSHPVTVQAGALVVQELLNRTSVYRGLRQQAALMGQAVFDSADFRALVRRHILELMRFRPVFPALARAVPRQTEFESGARSNPVCPAGSSVAVMSISALFDSRAIPQARSYCPQRHVDPLEPVQYLMFGYGARQCPAKEHALTLLTSALIGVLRLPELCWAEPWGRRIEYDGPMVRHMQLRFA